MADITAELTKLLSAINGAPFLFVGSGFSRRYIGLETWSALLARFCKGIKDYGYYLSSANGDLPLAATLMAADFNEMWWTSADFEASRNISGDRISGNASALKVEIAQYLKDISLDYSKNDALKGEVAALSRMNVDGIITTNWDLLLEDLFPDYKVFVGQEELLFSNPQSIAEIYKIHGCASRPSSLVLTKDDYTSFQEKNPYLAAKLITIFVEHPVIFLGYSINDPHIQALIGSIAQCLGTEKLKQFERNLIFVERGLPGDHVFEGATLALGTANIRVTLIRVDDFELVYSAVEATKRKIPARVLRYCKEQMYELVKSTNPETKLAVVDLDDIDQKDDVEFVVGVGVAAKHQQESDKLTAQGYKGVSIDDVFVDLTKVDSEYSAPDLLASSYPSFRKASNRYIPSFRYLRAAGINSHAELQASQFDAAREITNRTLERGCESNGYRTAFDREYKALSTAEIIAKTTPEKAAALIPFQSKEKVDVEVLRQFLAANVEKLVNGSYKSYFRKIACFYDALKFGF